MPPAGWQPDPTGRFDYRFFNGEAWTADVSAAGGRYVDPFGALPRRRDGRATAALVLGIVALTTAWMPFIFVAGAVCAVLAIAFGTIVLRRRCDPRGFALTGVITGVAALVVAVLGVVTTRAVTEAVSEFAEEPPATVELDRCAADGTVVTVGGAIENIGERASDYRVVVSVRSRALLLRRDVRIDVEDVDPGELVPFRATVDLGPRAVGIEPTCMVADVTGPPPFGFEL